MFAILTPHPLWQQSRRNVTVACYDRGADRGGPPCLLQHYKACVLIVPYHSEYFGMVLNGVVWPAQIQELALATKTFTVSTQHTQLGARVSCGAIDAQQGSLSIGLVGPGDIVVEFLGGSGLSRPPQRSCCLRVRKPDRLEAADSHLPTATRNYIRCSRAIRSRKLSSVSTTRDAATTRVR